MAPMQPSDQLLMKECLKLSSYPIYDVIADSESQVGMQVLAAGAVNQRFGPILR